MTTVAATSMPTDPLVDYRVKITFWIALAGFLTLAPLAIYHLLAGHLSLGLASSAVLAALAMLAKSAHRGDYSPLTPVIVPAVVLLLAFSVWQQGVIGLFWAFPAIVIFNFVLTPRWALASNVLTIATVIGLAASKVDAAVVVRSFLTLAGVSLFTGLVTQLAERQQERLHKLLVTDELTGLDNRTVMHARLEQELVDYKASKEASTLVTFDVDRAHLVKSTTGYKHGEAVLAGIAANLRTNLRDTDGIYRTGGEEFAVLLPNVSGLVAIKVAERVRNAIAHANLIENEQIIVSAGIIEMRENDTAESWIDRADRFLYEAKRRTKQGQADPFALTQAPQPQPASQPFSGQERREGPEQSNPFAFNRKLTSALSRKTEESPRALHMVKAS